MTRTLLIALLLLAPWGRLPATEPTLPEGVIPVEGRASPGLRLADMDGEPYDLQDARGRWVFVHFWASWCGPCRKEMPTIARLAEALQGTALEIVLVNTAETDDEVFSFLGIVAPDLTTLMDYDGLVTERWQPRGLPATFLVDPDGQIRYLALGGRAWDRPAYVDFLRALAGWQ
jgi:thiol-disulfide isomerase/thioredoxin